MRSSTFFTAAFAASVLATPMKKRADVTETDIDMVYVTDVVTKTVGAGEATVTSTANNNHYDHHSPAASRNNDVSYTAWNFPWTSDSESVSSAVQQTPSSKASTSSVYVAPSSSKVAASNTQQQSSTQAASSTAGGASATATTYQQAVLDHHNFHRTNHSASNIAWNNTLAEWAKGVAASCSYGHNTKYGLSNPASDPPYGQNIAAGTAPGQVSHVITELFYNGEVTNFTVNGLYGQAQPDMTDFEGWGHFTQVVWKDTQSVGCYTQACPGGLANVAPDVPKYFTVCNYFPAGNYDNEYSGNVGNSLNKASINGDYMTNCDVITDPDV